jgi:aminopeptidase N
MANTFSGSPLRIRRWGTSALVTTVVLGLVGAALPPPRPLGIGDRLFPRLGNPGYDVRAYDISLDYGGRNTAPLRARTVIDATVTAPGELRRFNLDFARGKVRSVTVDGSPARYKSVGEDLAVTPRRPLSPGGHLRVVVRHTSPTSDGAQGGWVRTKDGLAMANQADAAHRVFPGNDHPADKADFTFHVAAPRKLTVVSGGRLLDVKSRGGDRVWTYRPAHPMATELAQVSIGRSAVIRRKGPHGLPLRSVVPRAERKALAPWLARTPRQVAWLERRVGRYPFENYGVLMADATTGFELETQTLSLFEKDLFLSKARPSWYKQSVMVHELAHQWFGDSVSPHRWDDVWLNEANATWYEWMYGEQQGGPSLESRARAAYARSDVWRKRYGTPARLRPAKAGNKIDIFRPIVYDGSALVLYALREKIGSDAFNRLQRDWVAERRDGNASTADYIALASRVSGRDLRGFLKGWLYGEKTPPMTSHPSWKQSRERNQRSGRSAGSAGSAGSGGHGKSGRGGEHAPTAHKGAHKGSA